MAHKASDEPAMNQLLVHPWHGDMTSVDTAMIA
jgi:hypothetical protein